MSAKSRMIFAVLAAALTVTACGPADAGRDVASVPTTSATGTSGAAQNGAEDPYTKCMKENGAEPGTSLGEIGSGTVTQGTQSPEQQRKQQEAMAKCGKHLPDGGKPQPLSPEALEQGRKFAKCMRDQGIAFPDPDPNTGGYQAQPGAVVEPIPDGVDINDPAVRAKYDKCAQVAGGASVVRPTK
ncbi:hypothetical protein [Amycolatopsis sp.]|uniref:hypothetical protein n=1 Tax=Amycolatopsis sp. TaxID=37632 RepID=UPI002D7FF2BC|nr:hypothetical protein [Amycolatopsis sp.]HET6708970.1 hypothetical protein [Amycolatopsis sp.]